MRRSVFKWSLAAVCLFGTLSPASASDLGNKIAAYAAARVGQKGVGDGQCTRLVEQAFAAAGAKPGKNYVWGTTKITGGALLPGDIIQFEGAEFTNKDGSTWKFPHHTAIVEKASATRVTLLHQNVTVPRISP